MKITAFTSAWNSKYAGLGSLIDWYLNVIKVDKFIYADNYSTDGTIEFLKARFKDDNRLILMTTPYVIFDDDKICNLANDLLAADTNDAFIWIDSDEIIYHPNLRGLLHANMCKGKYYLTSFLTNVYNTGDTFDDDKPILDNFELCFEFKVQKSPIIIRSENNIKFSGGHHCVNINGKDIEWHIEGDSILDNFTIFHFCYITENFFTLRKTLPRNHLVSNNVTLEAISENGWWSRSLDVQRQVVEEEKKKSINIKDFLISKNYSIYNN